jgi:hypothetical protein
MTGRQRCDLILDTIDEVLGAAEPAGVEARVPAPAPEQAERRPVSDALIRWGVVPKPLVVNR